MDIERKMYDLSLCILYDSESKYLIQFSILKKQQQNKVTAKNENNFEDDFLIRIMHKGSVWSNDIDTKRIIQYPYKLENEQDNFILFTCAAWHRNSKL